MYIKIKSNRKKKLVEKKYKLVKKKIEEKCK